MQPLILETAQKAAEATDPRSVQTGPARRGDREVIERHIAMMEQKPELQEIYRLVSEEIFKRR